MTLDELWVALLGAARGFQHRHAMIVFSQLPVTYTAKDFNLISPLSLQPGTGNAAFFVCTICIKLETKARRISSARLC